MTIEKILNLAYDAQLAKWGELEVEHDANADYEWSELRILGSIIDAWKEAHGKQLKHYDDE